ncbi:MAG: 16S rRNA (cytidine(1402)-2'-O)-methyltransferase [Weeksellaceae bacterium]
MLYIVGTPIGNLEDISLRQARTLFESEVILSEDTRSTGILFQQIAKMFKIERKTDQKIIHYAKEQEFERLPEIIEMLEDQRIISLISQAGMPVISDPGFLLITHAIKNDLPFTVIPGPSAVINSLILSGSPASVFTFMGFLPKRTNEVKKVFAKLQQHKSIEKDMTFIFYESPHRINETLALIAEHLPEMNVSVTREMTKQFEETTRGLASEIKDREYRGEITLVIS